MSRRSAASGSQAVLSFTSVLSYLSGDWRLFSLQTCALRNAARVAAAWKRAALPFLVSVLLLGAAWVPVEAQTLAAGWVQQTPATSPSTRYIDAMTYDQAHGQVVLFGGFGGSGYENDTWLWNGATWTQANPATVPSPRAAEAMAYDATHGQVVMFGGLSSASSRLGDTWLWNGTTWTQANPVNSPPARASAVLAYYPGGLLLFGGINNSGYEMNDTWLWNGSNWIQQFPANSPSVRADYSMVYDPALGEIVLFGGDSNLVYQNDTWLWNGQNWTQLSTATSPPARNTQGMTYDQALGEVVMFGGYNGGFLNDTWVFGSAAGGTSWSQVTTASSPSGRYAPNAVTYDAAQSQTILFGGLNTTQLNDTWEFGLPENFGDVNVCPAGQTTPAPCSHTLTLTYNVATATTIGSARVVTQGASGLDFKVVSGGTCTGNVAPGSCTVDVSFAPLAPGARSGAVQLLGADGNVLSSSPLYGVGQGPVAAIGPGTQMVVNTTSSYSLSAPRGVAVDAAGDVYIGDVGNSRVLKVSATGSVSTVGVGLNYPQALAVDGAGDLFIADNNLNEVVEVPAGCTSSSCQQVLGSNLRSQLGVAVDGAGDVFIGDFLDGEVVESPAGCTTASCQTVLYNPSGANPVGLTLDATGDLFIADFGRKQVVEVPVGCTSSACQVTVGQGWSEPEAVAVDAAGDVFVADAGLQEAVEVPAGCTASGCQTTVISGVAPFGLAVDQQGDVFVPDLDTNEVKEVNRSQAPSLTFASTYVGSTSSDSPMSVSLQNIGNQTLSAATPGLSISGSSFVQVASMVGACSATFALAPGVACNLSISFAPTVAGNPVTSTAVFSDNALNANAATQSISLSGDGLPGQYTLSGTVTGLTGTGLVLQDNLGGLVYETGNYPFTFTTSYFTGNPYSVTVLSQPTGQICTVTNGSGTIGTASVTNVLVTCTNLVYYPLTVIEAGTGTGTISDTLGQISCVGAGGGTTGTCAGSYTSGTSVTLMASASTGSVFVGWGGACSSSGANASCTLTLNSALSVSASFVAAGGNPSGTLKPITAGVVYGQGGSFTSNSVNNGGISASSLGNSQHMVADSSGNLYVSDGANNRVLFYPAGSTTATRVYGQGGSFSSNASGVGAGSLNNPQGLALDSSGGLYVADDYNNRVLFYPSGSTIATRVYGQPGLTSGSQNSGGISANSLFMPIGIALDCSGDLYVADYGNSRVLFYPAASTTATRVYGQGGSFTSNTVNNGGISANSLNQPQSVALDTSGDVYVADIYNNRVLFYPANSTTATQVYGQSGSFTTGAANSGGISAASLNNPLALNVDSSGGLYVVDRSNNRVLYYNFGSTTATRVYGQGGSFIANAANNGGVSANSLNQPWGVTLDPKGNVYIADYGNERVLEYGSFGNVNACPAGQGAPAPCSRTVTMSYAPATTTTIGAINIVTQGVTGLDFTLSSLNSCTGTITTGTSCTVTVGFAPLAAGLRQGAIDIFDNNGNLVSTAPLYGVGYEPEVAFGPGAQSTVNTGTYTVSVPTGVTADGIGNLFISDHGQARVLKVGPTGIVTTVGFNLQYPLGVAEDGAGNVYIADNNLNQLLEVPAGCTSSSCQQVLLNIRSPQGVAVDGPGDVFVSDWIDGKVVEIPVGCTSSACQTVVYNAGSGSQPFGIAIDPTGDLFVVANGLKTVLEIPVGCTTSSCQRAVGAGWSSPYGIAVDPAGDVYVADQGLSEIIEVPPGCQSMGCQVVVAAGINAQALTVDFAGDVFAGDLANQRVARFARSQTPSLSFAQTNVGSTSADSPRALLLQNVGNQPLAGFVVLNLAGSYTQSVATDCTTAFPLAPGAACSESFSFTPQSATFFSGSAVFTDNALNNSPLVSQTIALSGTGAIGGVAGTVAVPNLVGEVQTAVTAPLASVSLVVGTVTTESSGSVPAGSVIDQSPEPGTQVAVGSAVNLLISTGPTPPPSTSPLSLNNNYFLTGDYVSAGVTMRGTGVAGTATGTITIPSYSQSATGGVPAGADIVDAFLYWESVEATPTASSFNATFNGYAISGQQIGKDIPNYADGKLTGTIRAYRADVNIYLPVSAGAIRYAAGTYTVGLPDGGGTALPLAEGASLVIIYRVLSPNFPLKSVVIYDGAALPASTESQVVQGFYDAVGGASGTGKTTSLFASGGTWNNSVNTGVPLGQSSKYSAPLAPANTYAAVILSTPINNSDNDGILDAWKTGPSSTDFHAGQPGYYDVKTGTWVGLAGAKHGEKDLFVQLDYMCGAVLANGTCDPTQENLFPSPDANGQDPLAMVQQAFAASGVQLHLTVGNAVPESTCVDNLTTNPTQLCQFPNQPGVIGWKNSLEFAKLYPRNVAACLSGGDCTTRFPFGQKDSFHYVLMGHSLAIPAWNTPSGTLTSIVVANGVTTIITADRGSGINACPSRITIGGVLGNPSLSGVYNTTGCANSTSISLATPGVPNWTYPNNNLPEPVIGLTSGTISSISGYSDLGGSDSAVTLGLWLTAPNQDMSKRANVLAGTIFHEIGHTLGLSHGGLYYDTPGSYVPTYDSNCKPNYQSVMNYLFQLDLLGPNQQLAYSNQVLQPINENSAGSITQLTDLSGNAATIPTSAWYAPYTTGSTASPATLHCDGTPLNGEAGYRIDSSIAPISPAWTNGQDLSFIGTIESNERGYNDVANLDLRQVGATGGEFVQLANLLSYGSSVAPLNIGAGGSATLGSGGTVALGSGGTVTLGSGGTVTLGSGGTVTLGSGGTVTLGSGGTVTLGSGGTVSAGSGGTVALGSGGTVTLGSGGTITLGSGGTVTLGSGGTVTLGSGGTIALGSGGTVTIPAGGGSYTIGGSGGTVTLGSGGTVALGSGGTVTLGSGGTIALGSGGTVTLGSGGTVTLGSGGTVTLGSGGTVALGSGGTVTLGSGGTVALGSGGTVTLGSGGTVTLGSGGTVTLGSGGTTALGSGGTVTLGSGGEASLGAGGTVTLGSGGTVTLGSGGTVTLGSGGTVTLGSGGTVALGSGGTVTLGSGGTVALGSGGTITLGSGGTVTLGSGGTVTLGSGGAPISVGAGGTVTLGSGGTVTLGSGGTVALGSGGTVTLGSGGTITLGSGGTVALGSGGTVTLGSGGTITLGSGGTVTLGSGGTVTLGSGGVVTLGNGGSVLSGIGSDVSLGSVNNVTTGSGGPSANELTYETANSIVRPPSSPSETSTPAGVLVAWQAPAFGVVQTYTVYRSSNGATPIVIGSVSGVNGYAPATQFLDTNPDLTSKTVVYTITTSLVPDSAGPSRLSPFSVPAVLKNSQTITLGPLPSSVIITNPPTVTATAMSSGVPNGLQVVFSASGSCSIGVQAILNNVSSATLTLNTTGSCTVTASQPGSMAFMAANSVSGTFLVLPQGSATQSQTISFATLPNVQYGNTFSLSASSSVGLPISFTASGPCTTGGTVNGVGVCKITASSAGSSTYSAAAVTQAFNVYPAVLKVTASNLASTYGQPLPSLTYGYSGFVPGDTASVVTGTPSLSTTATSTSNAGSYPITVSTGTLAAANYSFLYVSGTLTVQPANQAALVLNTTSPLTFNQSETLSVSGGSSKGAVTYNLVSGSPCTLTGASLKATSGTGACQVTATMAGNSNYNAVTSTPANSVTLAKASQTITFTTNPPATAAYNSTFTVAATASSGVAVSFTSGGSCSNSGGTFTVTSGTGSCSVIANQAGNANYGAATQATKTLTASLAAPVITWAAPASLVYGYGLTATQLDATASVPGTFVYNPPLGTVLAVGGHTLSVSFTPTNTADYSSVSATVPFTVNAATVTLGVSSGTQTYQQWTNFVIGPIYTGSRVPTGTGTLYDNGTALTTLTLGGNGLAYYTAGPFNVGANILNATYSGNSYFAAGASSPVTITVLPAPVNFQASCWGAQVYGTAYQCTVNVSASTSTTPGGVITYSLDGATPVSVPIVSGNAPFTVPGIPNAGSHKLVLSYAAQGNFAAAGPITESFTTAQGQAELFATPSSYYFASGSSLTISGTATTPSSGIPPGTVTVYDGSTALGSATIGSTGAISYKVASVSKGSHTYHLNYAGSANYTAVNSGSFTVTAN